MAYALARIQVGADVEQLEGYHPGGVGTIRSREYKNIGDSVSPEDLDLEEDSPEWEALFAEGVLSNDKPPEDWNPESESLNTFLVRQAVDQLNETTSGAQAQKVQGKKEQTSQTEKPNE